MYSPDDATNRSGGADTPKEQQAKRAIMAAFDAMVNETDQRVLNTLWQRVVAKEKFANTKRLYRIKTPANTLLGRDSQQYVTNPMPMLKLSGTLVGDAAARTGWVEEDD